MKILLIAGPNLNVLGERNPEMYGTQTLSEIEGLVQQRAQEWSVEVRPYQSEPRGAIIDFLAAGEERRGRDHQPRRAGPLRPLAARRAWSTSPASWSRCT